jgi:hypothetical protein
MNTVTLNIQTPEVVAPSISSSAMIVDYSASVWTARKKDKKASEDVNYVNNADKGVANVSKNILGHCSELDKIQKYAANVRNNVHYRMTMPWLDSGPRLLTTAQYFDYHKQMTECQQEFYQLVEDFLDVYDWKVTNAQAKVGGMFNPEEYPTLDNVRSKFAFRITYDELPDGGNTGDWRLDLPHETLQGVLADAATVHQNRLQGAMDSVWHRLHDNLTTLVHELEVDEEGKGNRLYQTVFDRAIELTNMLGTCNVTGDSQMEAMRRQLDEALHGTNLEQLKNNRTFREETRTKLTAAIAALPSLDM